MNNVVQFNNHKLRVFDSQNRKWFCARDIANALEFKHPDADICKLYSRHKDEFDEGMTCTGKMVVQGQNKTVRLYNREGAWLIGMFARTPKAVEFRKWVLKVLGTVADSSNRPVVVQEHTRSLPTGKKEIVLSEKAKTEIGGIVKSCLGTSQYRLKEDEVANRVVALMTSYNFLTQYDTLMREARELKYQAEQREQQARSFMEAANKIEKAVA